MKLYKALTFLLSFIPLALYAQNADQRINELLGSGDWFALNREYSEVKDSVQSDVLKSMTETMLAAYFNRPEELGGKLKTLIDNHSEEIGAEFVRDTIDLHGANHSGGTRTQLIRQMNIGGMEVNNILAYVLSDTQLDTLVRTDAIIGMDFLKLARNISIDFKRNSVTFGPVERKYNGGIPILYIEPNNTLCLLANINSETHSLKLDTGCTMTDLSYTWYCAHKDSTSDLEESNVLLGTYGSTE